MWLLLIARLALATHVVAAALAIIIHGTPPADAWLPAQAGIRVYAYAAVLLAGGLGLAVRPRHAAIAIAATLLVVLVEWLAVDPMHNTMNHLVPLFAECGLVIALAGRDAPREQIASTLVLFARLFLAAIFIAQGLRNLIVYGPIDFARAAYVAPLADSWMPAPLLWIAGVVNPFVQVAGGALFVLGLATRPAAIVLGLFLCQILFGHTLQDPFDSGPDVHSYALANLALVLVVLGLQPSGNRYSIDKLLSASSRASTPRTTR